MLGTILGTVFKVLQTICIYLGITVLGLVGIALIYFGIIFTLKLIRLDRLITRVHTEILRYDVNTDRIIRCCSQFLGYILTLTGGYLLYLSVHFLLLMAEENTAAPPLMTTEVDDE